MYGIKCALSFNNIECIDTMRKELYMMKKTRIFISSLLIVMMLFLLPACGDTGKNNTSDSAGSESAAGVNDSNGAGTDEDSGSGGDAGVNKNDSTGNGESDMAGDIVDGADDMIDDAADGMKDVADGVGDAMTPDDNQSNNNSKNNGNS